MKKIIIIPLLLTCFFSYSQQGRKERTKTLSGVYQFWDSTYFQNVSYSASASVVHLGLDTLVSSPTYGKLVRKTAGGGGTALSSITAAVGSNDIDNGTGLQEWRWNALAGNSGLKLSSTSTAAASNLQRVLDITLSGANSNASQTTRGANISNTHSGTTSTNVGMSADASGGTTNIAGYFSSASATNNYGIIVNGGSSGFGVISPTMKVQVQGRFGQYYNNIGVSAANDLTLSDANSMLVSGNTQINAITTDGWQQGSIIYLFFSGTPTVKNNTAGGAGTAVIRLAGAADFVASANDVLTLLYNGTDWIEVCRSVN